MTEKGDSRAIQLYIKAKNGRYIPIPAQLVTASVKFDGESLMAGFSVSLGGHLKDVDPEMITFAVTKGVTDILNCFSRFQEEISKCETIIADLESQVTTLKLRPTT